jgi:hypothetical protein
MNRSLSRFCLLQCLLGLTLAGYAGEPAEWTSYSNSRFAFCVGFPSDWARSEPITQNGITLAPKTAKGFVFRPTIAVGAYRNQPSEQDASRPQTLEELFQTDLKSLRESQKAEQISVVDKQTITIQGLHALASSVRYRDPETGEEWLDRDLNVIDGQNIVYFLELKCHPRDAGRLFPVYEKMLRSLRLGCRVPGRR